MLKNLMLKSEIFGTAAGEEQLEQFRLDPAECSRCQRRIVFPAKDNATIEFFFHRGERDSAHQALQSGGARDQM